MTKVEASIEINKPVKEVFSYASDWKHWQEWREGISELKLTNETERGNNTRYAYKAPVAWLKFNLETEIHYFRENIGWQGIVHTGLPHKTQWHFESKMNKTMVTYTLEYSPPWFLIGPLLDYFILKPNLRRILEGSLQNLKAHLENQR